jgi:hypothetical protein
LGSENSQEDSFVHHFCVRSLASGLIAGGEILIEMVIQGPDEPVCCPTKKVILTYEMQGEQLVQSSNRLID